VDLKKLNSRIYILVFTSLSLVLSGCDPIRQPLLLASAPSLPTTSPSVPLPIQATQTTSSPSTNPYGLSNYNVGDIIYVGDQILMISGWEFLSLNPSLKLEKDQKFIAVDLLIVNLSQTAILLSGLTQISLIDANSQIYYTSFSATTAANGGNINGTLTPGEKVRGKIGFQIPSEANNLQFIYDVGKIGQKVFINLGSNPISFDPPPFFPGEFELITHHLGERIFIDPLSLTVNQVLFPPWNNINPPAEGNKFLLVDLTIENKGASFINISSLLQMWVKDSAGRNFSIDLKAMDYRSSDPPDGEFSPSESKHGQVGFQVPIDSKGLVFVFQGKSYSESKVFITLE